jgi:hypothetical protein
MFVGYTRTRRLVLLVSLFPAYQTQPVLAILDVIFFVPVERMGVDAALSAVRQPQGLSVRLILHDAPERIRTSTVQALDLVTLPVGLQALIVS